MKQKLKIPKSKFGNRTYEIRPVKVWQTWTFLGIIVGLSMMIMAIWFSKITILDQDEYTQDGITYRVTLEKKASVKKWQGTGFLEGKSLEEPFILGKEIVIYQKKEGSNRWQEKNRYSFEGVGPWCVSIGQLDEDKDLEVFIGAYRATRYFPEGTRPYIFAWKPEEERLVRLWSGSYFDAPIFTSAKIVDRKGDGIGQIEMEEREWIGKKEYHYITYYTYAKNRFQPIKIERKDITPED